MGGRPRGWSRGAHDAEVGSGSKATVKVHEARVRSGPEGGPVQRTQLLRLGAKRCNRSWRQWVAEKRLALVTFAKACGT